LPAEVADLILSGHTHGGQVALPGLAGPTVRLLTGSRYVDGMYDVNGSPVYINRGLGCVGLPVRFRANPEVTLITLSR
jgi:predicted MPP superfamily phosphohydrolase